MSRWTENKRYFSKHGNDIWITTPRIYKVTTDQRDFTYRTYGKLNYKETVKNFYKAGFTNVVITFIGRDVTF